MVWCGLTPFSRVTTLAVHRISIVSSSPSYHTPIQLLTSLFLIVLTHSDGEVLPNNTLSGLGASHVGQIFFDQTLITEVETNAPYTENTQELMLNADDSILAEEADTVDPLVQYVYLGEAVSDGLLSWITIGIDPSESQEVSPAATWTEDGGVENEGSGGFPPM